MLMDLGEMCKGKRNKGPQNELGKNLKALLEIINRDVFKDLQSLHTGNMARQNPRSVPDNREELKVLGVKVHSCESSILHS